MKTATKSASTAREYEQLVKALYAGVKPRVTEIVVPPVKVVSVTGNQPPASPQFQQAIAVLYGIGYSLKMGLKFAKLRMPAGYFDYKVGALEGLWWSTGKELDINDPATLRWKAYLMVPGFVTAKLFDEARTMAGSKHPETPYEDAVLETVEEGHSVQMLHVGPYDQEQPTIETLESYMAEHGLAMAGRHHEIYISDPRRTKPGKLKTVIRFAVKPATTPRRGSRR
jgi:hypothetical protein